jgi:hypothetical protein
LVALVAVADNPLLKVDEEDFYLAYSLVAAAGNLASQRDGLNQDFVFHLCP